MIAFLRTYLFLFVLLPSALQAQEVKSKVLVHSNGLNGNVHSISIKWYTQEFLYPDGVNVYRKEKGQIEWIKLNAEPVKKLDRLPKAEYEKDNNLIFFTTLVQEAKQTDLQGLLLVNVLVKSFESSAFSKFLGIEFEDTAVSPGKFYEYKVQRIKGNKEELLGYSTAIKASSEETIEEPVNEIHLHADTNKVKIKWKPEEKRFYAVNIYRSSSLVQEVKKLNENPVMISKYKDSTGRFRYPETMFLDDSLKDGVTYFYKLTGVDFFGKETKSSKIFEVLIKDLTPPFPPASLKDSVNNLDVLLTWEKSTSEDLAGYDIYRSRKSDGQYHKLNKILLSKPEFTDKVTKAGPYYYHVSAVDSSGNQGKSDPVFVEVHDIVPPASPSDVTAKADTGKVIINWQKGKESDLMGYLIYRTIRNDNKDRFVLLNSKPVNENSFTDKLPRSARNKFLYKVIAIDSAYNKSGPSESVSVRMPDIITPVPPYLISVESADKSFIIEWLPNKEEDLDGYILYKSETGEQGSYKPVIDESVLRQLRYVDNDVKPRQTYFYYLVAVDSSKNKSKASNILTGVNNFSSIPSSVNKVKGSYRERNNDVHISWKRDSEENLLGYIVYRKEGDDGQLLPVSGKLQNNEFIDISVKKGTTYFYEIRSYSKTGDRTSSEQLKIKVQDGARRKK